MGFEHFHVQHPDIRADSFVEEQIDDGRNAMNMDPVQIFKEFDRIILNEQTMQNVPRR
jgi:hypothetical protein